MRLEFASFLAFALAAAPSSAQTTWVVDYFGAADSNFEDIQVAVDAASDGDLILIREGGIYGGFEIADKSLTLVADSNSRIALYTNEEIEIRDLSAGKTVVLRGFGPVAIDTAPIPYWFGGSSGLDAPPMIIASDCNGTIWIEDCSFVASQVNGLIYGPIGPGASFMDCLSVVAVDCRVRGEPALRAMDTGMHLYSCDLQGVGEGQAAVEMTGSFCLVSDSTIVGGLGGTYPSGNPCAGDGGDGFLLSSASELFMQGSVVQGGTVDPFGLSLCATVYNNLTTGVDGVPVSQDPASTVVTLPGTAHTYRTTPVAREGESFDRFFFGRPLRLLDRP